MQIHPVPDPRTATDADIASFIRAYAAAKKSGAIGGPDTGLIDYSEQEFEAEILKASYGEETVRDALAGVTNPWGNTMVTPLHERKALQDFSNISEAPSIRAALSQNVVQGNRAPKETPMNPALSDPMSAANRPNPGSLTANLRGSQMPNQKIDMNEALIRMGGAMSGVPMLENLGSSYGEIQDYNRAREKEAFGIEEARRKAIQDRITASTKAAEASSMSSDEMIQAETSYSQMQEAMAALKSGNLTGPIAGRLGAWLDRSGLTDRYFGNEAGARRAYMRSILQNIQVDDTLLKTANTKGAISDKEMELFKSPLPKITDDEGVWKLYIQQRMDVLNKIMGSQGTSSSSNSAVSPEQIAEADKLVNGG
jgi:hypothetical protein